eukprot:COSAG06_NODE_2431_length_6889_cov_345.528424_6_plen_105_part_00
MQSVQYDGYSDTQAASAVIAREIKIALNCSCTPLSVDPSGESYMRAARAPLPNISNYPSIDLSTSVYLASSTGWLSWPLGCHRVRRGMPMILCTLTCESHTHAQ